MALRDSIAAAFAAVAYPGDENLIRCPYDCAECRRQAAYFRGKTWEGQNAAEWREHHLALALFTPEAFQYFLPGFMLASLATHHVGDILPEAIRFQFEYVLEHRELFAVRMVAFTLAQRRVVIEYLRQMERRGAGSAEEVIGLLSEESMHA